MVDSLSPHLSGQDISQETWTRIWSRLPTFNGSPDDRVCRAMFTNWIKTTTRRVALSLIDEANAQKRGGGKIAEPISNGLAATNGHTPSSIAQSVEAKQKLTQLICELEDLEAVKILRLRFFDAMTIDEIASETKMTRDQVRYKIKTAVAGLKQGFGSVNE